MPVVTGFAFPRLQAATAIRRLKSSRTTGSGIGRRRLAIAEGRCRDGSARITEVKADVRRGITMPARRPAATTSAKRRRRLTTARPAPRAYGEDVGRWDDAAALPDDVVVLREAFAVALEAVGV